MRFYAVYYSNGKGKIFTRSKDFQRETAKKSAKLYRGFDVKIEAEQWLKSPENFPKEKKFFAVKVGRKPGIYDNLEEYEAQMHRYPHCNGKVFYTVEGAEYWLNHGDDIYQKPDTSFWTTIKRFMQSFISPIWGGIKKKWQLRNILQKLAENSNPWVYCKLKTNNKLIVYTDASFRDGKVGYAAVIIDTITGAEFYIGGSSEDIDNSNRAELYAIVSALRLIDEQCKASVEIRTDANSLVKVAKPKNLQKFNKFGWPEQWCTNSDLWKEFFRFTNQRAIQVTWVKGHDRDKYNNLCDKIAGQCSERSLFQQ